MQRSRLSSSIAIFCLVSGCALDLKETAVTSEDLSLDPDAANFPYEDLDDDGMYDPPDPVTGVGGDRDITFELMNPNTLSGSATCPAGVFCTDHSVVFPRKLKKFETNEWIDVFAKNGIVVNANLRAHAAHTHGDWFFDDTLVGVYLHTSAGNIRISANVNSVGEKSAVVIWPGDFDDDHQKKLEVAPKRIISADGPIMLGSGPRWDSDVEIGSYAKVSSKWSVAVWGVNITFGDHVSTHGGDGGLDVISNGNLLIGEGLAALASGEVHVGSKGAGEPGPYSSGGSLVVGPRAKIRSDYRISAGSFFDITFGPGSEMKSESIYIIGGEPLVFDGIHVKGAEWFYIEGDGPIRMRDASIVMRTKRACSVYLNPQRDYRPNPPPVDLTGTVFKNLQPESLGGDDVFDAAGRMSP